MKQKQCYNSLVRMKQWTDTAANDLRKWVLFGKVHKAVVKQPDHLINVGLKWEFRITSTKSVHYQINGVRWKMKSLLIFTLFNGKWLCTRLIRMNTVLSFSTLSYVSFYSLSSYFSFIFSYASKLNTAIHYVSLSRSFHRE